MTKNNKKRNAFFYFMLEWKEIKEKQGYKFPNGLKDVQSNPECNEAWRELSEEDKAFYKGQAKQIQQNVVKKTSTGVPIAEVQKAEREKLKFKDSMKQYIKSKINKAKESNSVEKLKFYVIHVNYYYQYHVVDNQIEYCPAEIGIAEFSLENGVTKIYNQIVRPNIALGYASAALSHSKDFHQLPTNGELGESDYAVIYRDIYKFLEPGMENGKLPPVYTRSNEDILNPVVSFINRLAEHGSGPLLVYSIEDLFVNLHNIDDVDGYPKLDEILADIELKKDPFDFKRSLECKHHKILIGGGNYCSSSIIQRWIFIICTNCCPFFDIDLKPGYHIPIESAPTECDDKLGSSFKKLQLNDSRPIGPVISTGAIRKCTKSNSEISFAEKERCRFDSMAKPLHIIDHSKTGTTSQFINRNVGSRTIPQNFSELSERPLRPPFTKPAYVDEVTDSASSYDSDFPSISVGRGRKIQNRTAGNTNKQKTDYASKLK